MMKDGMHYLMYRHPRLVLLLVAVIAACSGATTPTGPVTPPEETVATVEVTATVDTLVAAGESSALQVTLRDDEGNALTGRTVTWRSSNDAVAEVTGDASGATMSGLAPGTAMITAESEGQSATIEMRVIDADLEAVQALLEDDYTLAMLDALGGANADELHAAFADMLADLVDRLLSGVRAGLADTRVLFVTDVSEDDVVLHAVMRLVLDHAEDLLNF